MSDLYEGKPLYALETVATGRPRVVNPGEQLGHTQQHVVESLLERGLITDSKAAAERAGNAEAERRADVADQIERRAEKREQR